MKSYLATSKLQMKNSRCSKTGSQTGSDRDISSQTKQFTAQTGFTSGGRRRSTKSARLISLQAYLLFAPLLPLSTNWSPILQAQCHLGRPRQNATCMKCQHLSHREETLVHQLPFKELVKLPSILVKDMPKPLLRYIQDKKLLFRHILS